MKGKKVFVGMSGGVDSSVSAALLKERGFDVTGVFIKVWQPDWMECAWREDRLDAMRVATALGIPFETIDLEKEYKKEVVDYMIAEYKAGRTPNPDVCCNQYVKFGAFFDYAIKHGVDFVATGHYARTEGGKLLAGVDQDKDQSYFLYTLSSEQLDKTMFPVGAMEKPAVRSLARKYGLPVAEKKDSQGICFVGEVDIKEFLSHYIPSRKGDVLDEQGNVIGSHDGAFFLTQGERRGFTVTQKKVEDAPYYVTARDVEKNTVTVSHRKPDGSLSIERTEFDLHRVHWVGKPPEKRKKYAARIRHLGDFLPCSLSACTESKATVSFEEPTFVAAGQSVVLYDGDTCVGGGIVI